MDLFLYILLAGIYIMVIHFAVAQKNQFNLFLMFGIFAFGAIVGTMMKALETGFVAALILSLVLW